MENRENLENEIDLVEVLKKLWLNKKVIFIVTFVFMVLGVIYALCATPIYKSTLTMYSASGDNKASGLMGMAASFGMSVASNKETYNIEDVIKSRRIAREVVLHKWKTKKYDIPVDLLEFSGKEIKDSVIALYGAVNSYLKMISVETDKKTGLMKLNVESQDPILSAEIANYIGKAVAEHVQEFQGIEIKRNILHIKNRLIEVEKELSTAEEKVRDFRENNRDISSAQAQLDLGRLTREVEIKQGVYLTLSQQKELAEIEKIKKSPVINILDEAEIPIFKSKPKRAMICVLFTFLGGVLGIGLVILLPFLAERFGESKLSKLVK